MNDSPTAATPALTVSRELDAPRSLVWQAWTDPAHVARWWGPPGCTVTSDEADRRPGGRFRREMQMPSGEVTVASGTFEEVVPEQRLVTLGALERPGHRPMRSRMTVTFEDRGDKTLVTIVQSGPDIDADHIAGASTNWARSFAKLEAHLAATRAHAG